MFTTPLRIVLAVNAALLCVFAALMVTLVTRSATEPGDPPRVRTDRGISCVVGAPYVDGAGSRSGYVFDDECNPVATA